MGQCLSNQRNLDINRFRENEPRKRVTKMKSCAAETYLTSYKDDHFSPSPENDKWDLSLFGYGPEKDKEEDVKGLPDCMAQLKLAESNTGDELKPSSEDILVTLIAKTLDCSGILQENGKAFKNEFLTLNHDPNRRVEVQHEDRPEGKRKHPGQQQQHQTLAAAALILPQQTGPSSVAPSRNVDIFRLNTEEQMPSMSTNHRDFEPALFEVLLDRDLPDLDILLPNAPVGMSMTMLDHNLDLPDIPSPDFFSENWQDHPDMLNTSPYQTDTTTGASPESIYTTSTDPTSPWSAISPLDFSFLTSEAVRDVLDRLPDEGVQSPCPSNITDLLPTLPKPTISISSSLQPTTAVNPQPNPQPKPQPKPLPEKKRPRGRPPTKYTKPPPRPPIDILPKTFQGANLDRVEEETKKLERLTTDELLRTYDNGETLLHRYAAYPRRTDELRALLQAILHRLPQLSNQVFSDFVDKRDADGCTALLRAVSANLLESVTILVEIVPDVELLGSPPNLAAYQASRGSPRPLALSAVHLATASPPMLELVLKKLKTLLSTTQFRILEKRDEPNGRTPLLYAIEQNHPVESILLLLNNGANPCAKYIRDGYDLDGLALTIVYHSNPLPVLQSAMEVLVRDRPKHIPSLDFVINMYHTVHDIPVTLLDLAEERQPMQRDLLNFLGSKGAKRYVDVETANYDPLAWTLPHLND